MDFMDQFGLFKSALLNHFILLMKQRDDMDCFMVLQLSTTKNVQACFY